jgi:hypothetical protein
MAGGTEPHAVRVGHLQGGRLELSFDPVTALPDLETLTVEEAQAALTVFHASFLAERPDIRIIPSAKLRSLADDDPFGWERHLREKVVSRFGATLLPLPDSW